VGSGQWDSGTAHNVHTHIHARDLALQCFGWATTLIGYIQYVEKGREKKERGGREAGGGEGGGAKP
jgi:hypothetical protein